MQSVDRITVAQLTEYERADTPAVVVGAASEWRATKLWTPDYLKRRIGDVEIKFKRSATGMHPNFHAKTLGEMFATASARFAEFVDGITIGSVDERRCSLFTGDERFVLRRRDGQTTIDDALAPLLDDVVIPDAVPQDRLYTVWAWFSGPGVRTWLHYDNNGCHNLNAQLTGTKECLLFPPGELATLAPFPLGGGNPAHNCSQIDVEEPDLAAFPTYAIAERWSARLVPGDLLFIPAWWFHAFVHTGEFNSNVNFWWKPMRPALNPVAARQALVDAAAKLEAKDAATAKLLGELDRAMIARSS